MNLFISQIFYLTSICFSTELSSISDIGRFLITDTQTKFFLCSNNRRLVSRKSSRGERARGIKEDDTVRSYDPQDRRYDRHDSVESGSKEAYTLSTPLIRLHFFPPVFSIASQPIQAFSFSSICIRTRYDAFFPARWI